MSILSVLIYVVSFVLQSPISLNIYNQSQIINLTSPIYFMHNGKWHIMPDQGIDMNTVMRDHIEFDAEQDILEGALLYKIQKKREEFDKFTQDESKCIELLAIWHVEHIKELHVRTLLVEHNGELDEDKLSQLHQKYWHLLDTWVDPIENEWQLNDATVRTKIKTMNGGYRWDIFIYEEVGYNDKRPLWIDTTK
jgi:hypothetical protein